MRIMWTIIWANNATDHSVHTSCVLIVGVIVQLQRRPSLWPGRATLCAKCWMPALTMQPSAISAAVLCVFNYSADWIRSSTTLTRPLHLIGCYRQTQHMHPLACDVWYFGVAFLSWMESSRWSSLLIGNYIQSQQPEELLPTEEIWCETFKD